MAVILDGLLGPQISPMNLAGVLPWIHWRGLGRTRPAHCGESVLFRLPVHASSGTGEATGWRSTADGLTPASKQMAGRRCCSIIFLWAYEAFSLWDTPWWTAWIVLTYFVTCDGHRWLLQAELHSASTSARSDSFISCNRPSLRWKFAYGRKRDATNARRTIAFEAMNSREDANWISFSQRREAAWIAPGASTVCRPALMTTSESCRVQGLRS